MADQILVTASALESAQETLKTATGNAQQCALDAKNTISQLEGAWKGVAAAEYFELLSQIAPQMNEAAKVYDDIAKGLKAYVAKMEAADKF